MNQPDKFHPSLVQQIFFNAYGHLRSGWRFLIFLILFLLISTIFGAVVVLILSSLPIEFEDKNLFFFIAGNFLYFLCAVLIGWLCGKFLENLPFRALGCAFSNDWLKHLGLGLAFGVFSILLAGLIAFVFGGLSFQLNRVAGSYAILFTLGVSFLIFIIGAASEEALFRGYVLQTFSRARLAWFAIALTSVLFALMHLRNPSANYISSLNTALAGIWFAVAYLKTRTLWFPFGLHFMWNWIQGAFLGIPVSGLRELTTAPLLQSIDTGPAWLTGGDYGIEGGVACTIAIAATTLLIWFLPILKPTEEMLALTSEEKGRRQKLAGKDD